MTGHLEDWKLVLRVEALSSALQLACQLFLFALYPFSVSGCIQSFARREVQYRTSSWMLTDLGGAATGCGSARDAREIDGGPSTQTLCCSSQTGGRACQTWRS